MNKKFPREVGLPRKIIYTTREYLSFINKYNGVKKSIFEGVYSCGMMDYKADYSDISIDKLFFDFDEEDCWGECNKLHKWLLHENVKHLLIWSGRGFHLFISTKPFHPKNPKSTVYNAQMFFVNELKLNCDKQILGDISRLRRTLNTFNGKSKLFCIPLNQEDFKKGKDYCKKLAKKQNFKKEYIGTYLLDVSIFDYKIEENETFEFDLETNLNADYIKDCSDFIATLLSKKNLGWQERYLIILYFKEKGHTREEVYEILKENLSEKKFKHCIAEERQLQYLFERDDLIFPEKYCKVYK